MREEEIKNELRRAELDATNNLRQTIHSQEMSANRSLQLLNAGGAVALLAFLGQTWNAAPELRKVTALAISLMVIGLCLAVWGGFQLPKYSEWEYRRNESSFATKQHKSTKCRYLWTMRLSFIVFVVSVLILAVHVIIA